MESDPFIPLQRIRERAGLLFTARGLCLARAVAQAGESPTEPRIMQFTLTAVADWAPHTEPDDGFDEVLVAARRAERLRRAEEHRRNLDTIAADLEPDDDGFL